MRAESTCVICGNSVPAGSRGVTCSFSCRALLRERRKTKEWRTQREYPIEILSVALGLYDAGCTIKEVQEAIGAGYKAQRIIQRYAVNRHKPGKRNQVGSANHMWSEAPSYQAVHLRMGAASERACTDCGHEASNWSYKGGCASEMVDSKGRRYCTHAHHYEPRCVPCHYRHDHVGRRTNGQWLSRGEMA